MTDITSAAVAASGVAATATITATWIGVDPLPLLFATLGCGLASTVPRGPLGRARATVMFLCAVPLAALAGQWGAEIYMPMSRHAAAGMAAAAGLALHYGLGAMLAQIEPLLKGWADKLGASR